jgi:hypothetical protein
LSITKPEFDLKKKERINNKKGMLQVKVDMENSTNYTRYTTGGREKPAICQLLY